MVRKITPTLISVGIQRVPALHAGTRSGEKMHESALKAYLLALLIGAVAELRSLTAPALVSWVSRLGRLELSNTWLAFLGYACTPWSLTLLAAGEWVVDQLPSTPSRPRRLGSPTASSRERSAASALTT